MKNNVGQSGVSNIAAQNYDLKSTQKILHGSDSEKPEGDKGEGSKERQISVFGLKMSYSRAFGIAFLVLFVLLFFPGFGVSSAGVKAKKEVEQGKKPHQDGQK